MITRNSYARECCMHICIFRGLEHTLAFRAYLRHLNAIT